MLYTTSFSFRSNTNNARISFLSDDPYALERTINDIDAHVIIANDARSNDTYIATTTIYHDCIDIFTGLLFMVGICNIINLLLSNVKEREADYAALISLGLTKKQLQRMVYYENGKYLLVSFLIGTIGGGSMAIFLQLYNHQPISLLLLPLTQAVGLITVIFLLLWFGLCRIMIRKIQTIEILRLLKVE